MLNRKNSAISPEERKIRSARRRQKLRNRTITICQVALLIALEVVLNRMVSINTMGLKIGLAFVPMALCAMLFGPVWAAASYAAADFIGAMVFPIGPYFPGFTIMNAFMGLIYWLFLNRGVFVRSNQLRPAVGQWIDISLATVINCLVFGLLVNTLWVSMLYASKGGYWYWFAYRLSQYVVLVPLHLIFLPFLKKFSLMLKRTGIVK